MKILLNIDRLFSILWFSYCVLIPIVFTLNSSFRAFIFKFNLPVVPIGIGVLFLLNYAASKALTAVDPTLGRYVVETKEFNLAFLFFLISLYFFSSVRSAVGSNRTGADSA